jgi:hypothetical protein
MKLRKLFVTFTFALASSALGKANPQPAVASCAFAPSLARGLATARVVFVGRVVATRNRSRTAVVRVQDIWRGTHVPKIAIVNNDSGEDYRLFRKGVTYLFFPEPLSHVSPYWDDACSATQRYSPALAKYRPEHAHRP